MNCKRCGHKNPLSAVYCTKCGTKLQLGKDELKQKFDAAVKEMLEEEGGRKRKLEMEEYSRGWLWFGIILFLIAITISILAGSPLEYHHLPSISYNTEFIKDDYTFTPVIEKRFVPLETERK
jgi:uncharacterized membrane protein YvbJ